EAPLVEPPTYRGDHSGASSKQVSGLGIRHQVELAVPLTELDVLEPVVLVGRRAQALRKQGPAVESERELAALGHEDNPLGADDVAEVEPHEMLERFLP